MENLSVISRNPSVIYIGAENIDEDRIDGEFYNYKYLENEIKLKKSGIKIKVLNDVIERMNSPIGWQGIPSSSYLPHGLGVPLIRVQNVSDLILDEESLIGVEESIYDEQPAIQAQANDIIITRVGTIGRVCRIPEKINRIAMGQNLTRIKLNETLVESGFMLAYMSSKFCQIQMERYAYGGVQASLTNKNIKQLLVPIPSPEIQKYIGDKVRKAEELREEAKRLKKEAEEILNKELNLKDVEFYIKQTNNKKYSWTESIEIEDRIDSEFYKPKYRYLSKLNNMSELSYYYKISKKRINKNIDRKIKYIDLSSVNNIIEPSDFNTKELPSRAQFLVKEGNLIISTLKGSNKISIIPEHLNDSVCSTGFIVIASKSHLTTEYLYLVFSNKVFNMQIERYSTGSIMSGVNHDNFNKMLIPVISNKQIIDTITNKIRKHFRLLYYSKQLIQEAKQDVEDLIEGNFDMSKIKAHS